jgi:hypothetical protein
MERYDQDQELIQLANSLKDRKILSAKLQEDQNYCLLSIMLDDGRIIEVGVSGNLYDEAYFIFQPITHEEKGGEKL